MGTTTEKLINELENDCLYEPQNIPEYDGKGGHTIRKYFSKSELEDSLLISLKRVRKTDDIPESLEDVSIEEKHKVICHAAATCIRKIASDARSDAIDSWQKELFGECPADRRKTADWYDRLAEDYEKAAI